MVKTVNLIIEGDMVLTPRKYLVTIGDETLDFVELALSLSYIKSKIKDFDFRANPVFFPAKEVKDKFQNMEKDFEETILTAINYTIAHKKVLLLALDHVRTKLGEVLNFKGELKDE